jgi:glycosyltransferase involved in cell wall biosynthesis
MKILFMAPQPFFQARGTPINVRNVLSVLGKAGHQADLLTYGIGEDIELENVSIKRIPKIPSINSVAIGFSFAKIPLDILMFFKGCRLLFKGGYDFVHAVEESVFMAYVFKKLFKVRYLYDMDSSITAQLLYSGAIREGVLLRALERIEKAAVRDALAVLTVCGSLTRDVGRVCPGKKVFQVEDCPLATDKASSRFNRSKLNIKKDDIMLLYTGNLEPYQGVDMLVKSLSFVLREAPGVRLVIAGGEPGQIDELKRRARQAGVEFSVHFTGKIPLEDVPSLIKASDILVSPRLKGENTPLKIFDYLASGKPVAATDLPMHTQVLTKSTASLAPPEPALFAGAILKLVKSPSARARLGKNGKKLVKENYSFDVFSDKILSCYSFIENSIRGL